MVILRNIYLQYLELYCNSRTFNSEIPFNIGISRDTFTSPTPKVALAARSIKRHADTVTEFNGKLLNAIKRKEVDKAAYIRY